MKKFITILFVVAAFSVFENAKAQYVTLPDTNFRNWFNANGFSSCLVGNTLDTTKSLIINTNTLNINAPITNFLGLQYFKHLRWLQLQNFTATSLGNNLPNSLTKLNIQSATSPLFGLTTTTLPHLDTLIVNNCNGTSIFPTTLPATLLYFDCSLCRTNTTLPTTLPAGLLYFDCSESRVSSLPALPIGLKYLICRATGISSIPTLPSTLIYLGCSNNNLHTLPTLPITLTNLDCYGDSLTTLTFPSGIGNMSTIYCFDNQLTSIVNLPAKVTNLEANNNQLTTLPSMPNVQTLYLDHNNISSLPNFGNGKEFPDSIINITLDYNNFSYTYLDFSNTILQTFSGSYANKNSNTGIYSLHLPGTINSFYASHNAITSNNIIIDTARYQYYFQGLDLSYNQLTDIGFLDAWRMFYFNSGGNQSIVNLSHNQISSGSSGGSWYNYFFQFPSTYLSSWNNYSYYGGGCNPYNYNGYNFYQLDLSYNNISGVFYMDWVTAQILNISHNQINTIWANSINYGCYVPNYQANSAIPTLICSYNQLDSIPSGFYCQSDLIADHNNLSYLNANVTPTNSLIVNHNLNLGCLPVLYTLSTLNFDSTAVTCVSNYGSVTSSTPLITSVPLCTPQNDVHNCPIYANVGGTLYFDNNNNCMHDYSEPTLGYKGVSIYSGSSLVKKIFTGTNGTYNFAVAPGSYTLSADTFGSPYTVTCPVGNSQPVTATITNQSNGLNFAFGCKPGFDIGIWSAFSYSQFFPGDNSYIHNNIGDFAKVYGGACNTSGLAGQVKLVFTGPVSFAGAATGAIVPSAIHGDTVIWNVADFSLVNPASDFNFNVHTLATAQAGNQVCFNEWVTPIIGDKDTTNNYYSYCASVVNSFDPNYKEVTPAGALPPAYKGYLTYTIHFQNTGSASAHNIVVLDTLQSCFDLSTFELLGASHNVNASLNATNGIAEFDFLNIFLADSSANEPLSHGWVQFKIKLKSTVGLGVVVGNRGSIYFDFNPPVVTNTIANHVCVNSFAIIHKTICANQTYNFFGRLLTTSGIYKDTALNYTGCDSIAILHLTVNPLSASTLSKTICANHTYSFNSQVLNSSGTYYDTLINYLGCDSVVTLHLTVKPISTDSFYQNICASQAYNFNGKIITTSGTYKDTLQNYLGCDSFITMHLSVYANASQRHDTICSKDYYVFNGHSLSIGGTYYDTLKNILGCDSIVTLQLYVDTLHISISQNNLTLNAVAPNGTLHWYDCVANQIIPGSTNSAFTPTSAGYYAVIVSAFGCTDTSACYFVYITGIADIKDNNLIKVVPNPCTNCEIIINTTVAVSQLQITDLLGRTIAAQLEKTSKGYLINMPNANAGVYFIRNTKTGQVVKFVKE